MYIQCLGKGMIKSHRVLRACCSAAKKVAQHAGERKSALCGKLPHLLHGRALASQAKQSDARSLFAKLQVLSRQSSPSKDEAAAVCDTLARRLKTEIATFTATEAHQLSVVLAQFGLRNTLILDTLASHALRGMVSYSPYLLCGLANSFARNRYLHRPLMDAIAIHVANASDTLSPVDIAVLVYGYADLAYNPRNNLLEVCAERLQKTYLEVGAPNCASIMNSYARLSECNPAVFHCLSRAIVHAQPETFEVHNISIIMNSYAKCAVRKSQTMHLLGDYLVDRVDELSPQNVSNVVHAFSRLSCYNLPLFQNLVKRVASEDLTAYKLYELGVLCHNLAKLKSGGEKVYSAMFGELAKRPAEVWEPKAVAQVLDAMRRRQMFSHPGLLVLLFQRFFSTLPSYSVHSLTQASWCLVELDALDCAEELHQELPPDEAPQGFPQGRYAMRRVFERLQELDSQEPFTPTQRCHVQTLIRAYRYRHELDHGLLPPKVKSFCKAQFDVSSSVVSAVARA